MKCIFRKRYILFIAILILILYLFRGPLFPWNPIKSGFKRIASSKATLYVKDYDGVSSVYSIDKLIQEEEKFHDLNFKKKFKIIIPGGETGMKRFLPWLKGSTYSVKLGSVNVIYIGPTGRNSPYGIDVFLKHEISHLLIHQHVSSSKKNFEILKQGWLAEGIATFYGGPHYYEKDEFIKLWLEKGMGFDSLYEADPHEMDKDIIRLKYTYYRFFTEFLINTFGLEQLQYYLKSYITNPENYKALFSEVFNEDIYAILVKFNKYMNQVRKPVVS